MKWRSFGRSIALFLEDVTMDHGIQWVAGRIGGLVPSCGVDRIHNMKDARQKAAEVENHAITV